MSALSSHNLHHLDSDTIPHNVRGYCYRPVLSRTVTVCKMPLACTLLLLFAPCLTSAFAQRGGAGGVVIQNVFKSADTASHTLASVSSTGFTTLTHPAFPEYGVRIKQSKFCDGTVR